MCAAGKSDVDAVVIFLRLTGDWVSDCGRGGFMWMILRDRVGGDGNVKGSSSDMGLSFLVLAEAGRLTDLVSVGAREPVALEFCEPFSAADCNAGGGRVRFDSEADDELHGLSCAAISVEAAGVRGRIGVGMSLKILIPFEED